MKSVVVTGVSTGIGRAAAEVLLKNRYKVFGSVRKAADAEQLRAELGTHFTPLIFDVTDAAAVAEGAQQVKAQLNGQALFGLVNNAGIAVPGPLLHMRIEDFRHQLEVNLTGQLIVTQAFIPLLDGPEPGRIVMMSSVAGRNASPFTGAYNTTKFGLEGLSESLRRELMVFGIDVVVVAPGVIDTPIWDKAEQADMSHYAETVYAAPLHKTKEHIQALKKKGLPAQKIGEAILKALTDQSPRTRYTVTHEPVAHALFGLLPKRWADKLYAKALGLSRSP